MDSCNYFKSAFSFVPPSTSDVFLATLQVQQERTSLYVVEVNRIYFFKNVTSRKTGRNIRVGSTRNISPPKSIGNGGTKS